MGCDDKRLRTPLHRIFQQRASLFVGQAKMAHGKGPQGAA